VACLEPTTSLWDKGGAVLDHWQPQPRPWAGFLCSILLIWVAKEAKEEEVTHPVANHLDVEANLDRQYLVRMTKSPSFSDVRVRGQVRVRKFRTLKTLRTQPVRLFTHLYSKEVNISQKISEILIFSFLKSYYFLYKPHAQISTIVKTS
jgi:hypothetical protein